MDYEDIKRRVAALLNNVCINGKRLKLEVKDFDRKLTFNVSNSNDEVIFWIKLEFRGIELEEIKYSNSYGDSNIDILGFKDLEKHVIEDYVQIAEKKVA